MIRNHPTNDMQKEPNKFSLKDHKKVDPFQAPEGYFDSLEGRIMDRIEEDQKPVIRFFTPMRMGIAATFALVMVFWFVFKNYDQDPTTPAASEWLSDVSDADIVVYLDFYEDFDLQTLIEHLDEASINQIYDIESGYMDFELDDEDALLLYELYDSYDI